MTFLDTIKAIEPSFIYLVGVFLIVKYCTPYVFWGVLARALVKTVNHLVDTIAALPKKKYDNKL